MCWRLTEAAGTSPHRIQGSMRGRQVPARAAVTAAASDAAATAEVAEKARVKMEGAARAAEEQLRREATMGTAGEVAAAAAAAVPVVAWGAVALVPSAAKAARAVPKGVGRAARAAARAARAAAVAYRPQSRRWANGACDHSALPSRSCSDDLRCWAARALRRTK